MEAIKSTLGVRFEQFEVLHDKLLRGQVDADVFYLSALNLLVTTTDKQQAHSLLSGLCEAMPKGAAAGKLRGALQRHQPSDAPKAPDSSSGAKKSKGSGAKQKPVPPVPAPKVGTGAWVRQPCGAEPPPGRTEPVAPPAPVGDQAEARPTTTALAAAQGGCPDSLSGPSPKQPKAAGGAATAKRSPLVVETVVIHFHHILNPDKRESLQAWAHELDLRGASRTGTPGVVVIEGTADAIREYIARLRTLKWQTMEIRGQERVVARLKKSNPKPSARAPIQPAGKGGWWRGGQSIAMRSLETPSNGLAFCLGTAPSNGRPLERDAQDFEEVQSLDQLRRFPGPFREVARLRDLHHLCDNAGVGDFVRQSLEGPCPATFDVVAQEADRTVERGLDPALLKGAIYSEKRVQREKIKGIQDLLMHYELEKAKPE